MINSLWQTLYNEYLNKHILELAFYNKNYDRYSMDAFLWYGMINILNNKTNDKYSMVYISWQITQLNINTSK